MKKPGQPMINPHDMLETKKELSVLYSFFVFFFQHYFDLPHSSYHFKLMFAKEVANLPPLVKFPFIQHRLAPGDQIQKGYQRLKKRKPIIQQLHQTLFKIH